MRMGPCCGRPVEMNIVGYSIQHPMYPLNTHPVILALVGQLVCVWGMHTWVLVVCSLSQHICIVCPENHR